MFSSVQGIEFLYFAANPAITKFLSDLEFSVSVPLSPSQSYTLQCTTLPLTLNSS
jgi:hypothetical protein